MADNIYSKLNKIKLEFNARNVKKSGNNKHSGFDYYELSDIQPVLTELCDKYNVYQYISFDDTVASLILVNVDEPEQRVVFTSPMREISIPGANAIQSLGGIETYQRRYLLLMAFDITEPDLFDATAGTPGNKEEGITSEQVQWIKDNIDVPAMLTHLGVPSILSLTKVQANAVIQAKKRQLEKANQ